MKLKFIEPSDIETLMAIENASFAEGARQSKEELLRTAGDKSRVGILALSDTGTPIGYVIGSPLENYDYTEDAQKSKNNTIYCESIAVMPEERGKGIGTTLYATFLLEARKKGFERETDHAYKGRIGFREKFSPKILQELENWYDDGQNATYSEIDLKKLIKAE